MSRTTKALLITAVAVMLVGATNAYGYEEAWDGCFNYGGIPPIYSAHWVLSESDPPGLRGTGGSEGELQDW